jgi:hypothetical protein
MDTRVRVSRSGSFCLHLVPGVNCIRILVELDCTLVQGLKIASFLGSKSSKHIYLVFHQTGTVTVPFLGSCVLELLLVRLGQRGALSCY